MIFRCGPMYFGTPSSHLPNGAFLRGFFLYLFCSPSWFPSFCSDPPKCECNVSFRMFCALWIERTHCLFTFASVATWLYSLNLCSGGWSTQRTSLRELEKHLNLECLPLCEHAIKSVGFSSVLQSSSPYNSDSHSLWPVWGSFAFFLLHGQVPFLWFFIWDGFSRAEKTDSNFVF